MKLSGEKVKHKTLGVGKIVDCSNNYVTIIFENKGTKKFMYPAAFGTFLELENKSFTKKIEEDKVVMREKKAEEKKIKEEHMEQLLAMINNKEKSTKQSKGSKTKKNKNKKNNIAFKCNYCDGGKNDDVIGYSGVCSDEMINYNIKVAKHPWCARPECQCSRYLNGEITRNQLDERVQSSSFVCYESQMLINWRAYSGIVGSGKRKGLPMTLRSVNVNSLAMLTTRLPKDKDSERVIFAVFLVDKKYEGDNKDEGYVEANLKYKIKLSLEEAKQLKFWDFYFNPNKPEKIVFGSGLHRYLTDIQSAQVLKKITEIKKDTAEEKQSIEFLQYYCQIKGIDIDDIPEPNGGLKQI